MIRNLLKLALICTLLIVPGMDLAAKTMYVRNWMVIAIRSAPDEAAASIANATTNDPVEILEEGDGWTKVRTQKRKEGWVPTRYLAAQASATVSAQQCEEQIKVLREENTRLQGLIAARQGTAAPVPPQAAQPGPAPGAAAQAPSDCSALQKEYDKLQKEHKALVERYNTASEENSRLKTSERLTFTVIGGVFVIFGIFVGLLLQVMRSNTKKGGLRF